ncbi:MAG: ral stress protein [Phenylobacterium sp.]|nr:ral stress protein [Phenylobacterium sp.]
MSPSDPEHLLARFWRELGDLRTGMLGLAGDDEGHAQPMTAHFEGEHGPLWFYARKESRIALACAAGHPAVFHYIGRGHDLYACVHGEVAATRDRDAIDRFWSEEVGRWYRNGPDDPSLSLLRFAPLSAQIWLPSGGDAPALFGFGKDGPRDIHAEVRL